MRFIPLCQNAYLRLSLFILFFIVGSVGTSIAQNIDNTSREFRGIDSLIKVAKYDEALAKITSSSIKQNKGSNQEDRLRLQLLEGRANYRLGKNEEAIKLLLSGFDEVTQKPEFLDLSYQYASYLGKYLALEGNYDKSNYYYYIALNNQDTNSYTLPKLRAFVAIGKNFHAKNDLDSAAYYFEKMIDHQALDTTGKLISESYSNLGIISSKKGDFNKAEAYFQDALRLELERNDTIEMTGALINLSSLYYSIGAYDKASDNYLKAYQTIENIHSPNALKLKEYTLYNLAYTANELKDYKNAYLYLDQATTLTDSIAKNTINRGISEIEAKYNLAKEAQRTEEQKSKAQRAQFLFYGSLMTILALLLIGYIFYRNYRLKQLSEIEKIENETQTKIINATIDAKEKERKSIAETLHDSVSALLSSANLHLQATKSQLKETAPIEIEKAQSIVNEASVKIRDLSHELISSVLLKFGLAFAIHDMCQKYSNSKLTLHNDDKGIVRYDQDFEIKIHNIIEELINNILKHSKATHATIALEHKANDRLSIRISDDGIGFNPQKAKNKNGLGLSHIYARIKVMKGVFIIETGKGQGTSIFIEVPVLKKKPV
ncbi:ATP-binding protein [Flavobacteriaceae bacterium F08102]|nr:ATP-binding protein [Flavobacteriaceae bacterium F08102]